MVANLLNLFVLYIYRISKVKGDDLCIYGWVDEMDK